MAQDQMDQRVELVAQAIHEAQPQACSWDAEPVICESASNTDPCAGCRYAHDVASKFVAAAGSSSAPMMTPPDLRFGLPNQGFVHHARGVNLRCHVTLGF
jgi:hypothetical protein